MFAILAMVAMATETPDPPPVRQPTPDPPPVKAAGRVVPPGSHAHIRIDGTWIIHGDENIGRADAHRGIAWPWPKAAFPGQRVP